MKLLVFLAYLACQASYISAQLEADPTSTMTIAHMEDECENGTCALSVLQMKAKQSSTQPSWPPGYLWMSNTNCYRGHGALDISTQSVNVNSDSVKGAEECAHKCNRDGRCDCFTHRVKPGQPGECWLKAECSVAACTQGDSVPYVTYMKIQKPPAGYLKLPLINCYPHHGAMAINYDAINVDPLYDGIKECADECNRDSQCDCFVYGYEPYVQMGERWENTRCWKRRNCKAADCVHGAAGSEATFPYVTYIKAG